MKDINYPQGDFAGRSNEKIGPLRLDPPEGGLGFSDIFKNSNCCDCEFTDIVVSATKNKENGWDANNRCKRNKYKQLLLSTGDGPAVYLKDGFCDNEIDDVLITKFAAHSDWFEGDFSDQGGEKNRNNKRNNVRRIDGKPVRVRWTFFRAEKPVFTNSNVEYMWFWSFVSTIYVEIKHLFV